MSTTKQCRFCKEEILKDAVVCKHCNKSQAVGAGTRIGQFFLFLIVMGFVISFIAPSSDKGTQTATPQASEFLKTGEDGYVSVGGTGNNPVLVGVTKDYYDEMFKLIAIKDNLGVSQMVMDGKVLMVDNGTAIKVIGSTMASREVRITEGKYIGKSGWVPNEMVHRK